MTNKPLPRIPSDVFVKMLKTLPLDDLRQLPASKLPLDVPQDVVRSITGERREIIDELLFEANSHYVQVRLALEQVFGNDFIQALDYSKKDPSSAISASLKVNIDKFVVIVDHFINKQDKYATDAVKRAKATLAPEIKKSYKIKAEMTEFTKMLTDGFHLAGEYQPEFKAALKNMNAQKELFNEWLSKYYLALLKYVKFDLDKASKDVESSKKKIQMVFWEIAEIKKRIVSAKQAMGLSSTEVNHNHFIQELKQDLRLMQESKTDSDIMLPEVKLTKWLDALIDAYLCPVEVEELDKVIQNTRESLSVLLENYCELQLKAAEQIEHQDFTVLDKEKNIKYMLETERFINRYFKEKDFDVKTWSNSDGNIERLKKIEQELLTEIQQHSLG